MFLRPIEMHGLGNNFIALSLISQHAHVQPKHVKLWGDRNTGVGFSQLLIVGAPSSPGVDLHYRIFNVDGLEAGQYGDGVCYFARFVQDKHPTVKKNIRVETKGGIIEPNIRPDGQVTVGMDLPCLAPAGIPSQAEREALSYEIEVNGQRVELAAVPMGNLHGVLHAENVDSAPIHSLGPQLEVHPRFLKRANIGFPQVPDPYHARPYVWERGVDETQACGAGAYAVAVARIRQGWLQSPMQIGLPGGRLHIERTGPGQLVMMTGPAVHVYEDQVRL